MSIAFHQTPVMGSVDPISKEEKKVVVVEKKIAEKKKVYVERKFFPAPTEVKGVIERISFETGVPYNDIEKVMWCESGYSATATHVNNNGSTDKGLLQLNSIHKEVGIKMGLDFYNPDDNATFAIHLIKNKIKAGRPPLQDWVCKP